VRSGLPKTVSLYAAYVLSQCGDAIVFPAQCYSESLTESRMSSEQTVNTERSRRAREVAEGVFAIEAEAIQSLSSRLGDNFDRAVEMMARCKGRIIVTGIGKAGIIGQKLATTLSSVGTPAYFVHPQEALHGDLGMIARDDVVIAISNSGETEEVLRVVTLLNTVKKIGARILSLTGNPESTLAKNSDLNIDISVEREACPMNLVPTASSAAALAMGDALAMVLLERKGLSLEEYAYYHPGGTTGRKILKIEHVMRKKKVSPTVPCGTKIIDALHRISEAHAGMISIVDGDGRLVGVFTDGDLRRAIEKDSQAARKPIDAFMTRNPVTVNRETLVAEALRLVKEKDVGALVVTDKKGKPVGMVDERDLLGLA
jgi:arabinose-5-phosphate isomerase